MEIGLPRRKYVIEPLEEPVPREAPDEPAPPVAPEREPSKPAPELVPG
jgi:hypothetical protein